MSFARLFCASDGKKVLGLYSNNPGVVYAEPPGAKHLAHVTWFDYLRGRDSNIDYFLVQKEGLTPNEAVQLNGAAGGGEIEGKLDFRYRILNGMRDHTDLIRAVAVRDVGGFMSRKEARRTKQPGLFDKPSKRKQREYLFPGNGKVIEFVDGFVNGPKVCFEGEAHIQGTGKQDYYPGCILDINLDFARWCQSGITPDGKLAPWNSCFVCYSAHTHSGFPYAFRVDKGSLREQIKAIRAQRESEGKPTRYLRLGKRTECGSKPFRGNLVRTLEACADEGIKCIFPTKFLEFDSVVAELLRRTDSSLLVSLGNDELEQGPVLYGRTQEVRVEDGIKYKEAGARVIPYAMVDGAKEDGGEYFDKALRLARSKFERVQLLPVRSRHEAKSKQILGGWHNLIADSEQAKLFDEEEGAYEKSGDHTRVCMRLHPSLKELIGDNTGNCRMCHHSSQFEACGMCFMTGEEPFFRDL